MSGNCEMKLWLVILAIMTKRYIIWIDLIFCVLNVWYLVGLCLLQIKNSTNVKLSIGSIQIVKVRISYGPNFFKYEMYIIIHENV